jgi:hypothetical protein
MIFSLLFVTLSSVAQMPQVSADEYFAAVRKNDAAAVEKMLAAGLDVNTKYRYNQTALFPAADKGNTEVVRVLLAHNIDLNVEDTFYHFTALGLALDKERVEVVKLLLEKGAKGKDQALQDASRGENVALVRAILGVGGFSPETLTRSLGRATRAKRTEIADLLTKAGATPPPPEFAVDEETLKSYAGNYKTDGPGPALGFVIKDGKLSGGVPGQPPLTLFALSKTKFTTVQVDAITFEFKVEDGKVTGLTLLQGNFTGQYKKSEAK